MVATTGRPGVVRQTESKNIAPVFLFAAGWRSGSTLLQRLIISSGQVLMWGEAGGALNALHDVAERYAQMVGPGDASFRHGMGGSGGDSLENFREKGEAGVHEWIACMNMPEDAVYSGLRSFFDQIYSDLAVEMGYSRWGVKEVILGVETVCFFRKLYPDAKFVFLVRDPFACLLSLKRRRWLSGVVKNRLVVYFSKLWCDLALEFKSAEFGLYLRYEDLINNDQTLKNLQDYLEVKSLSLDFVRNNQADWKTANKLKLTFREKFTASRILGDEMRRHGYEINWRA